MHFYTNIVLEDTVMHDMGRYILDIGLQNKWVNIQQAPTLDKSVVASSGVSGEPVRHRLLHVGENLYKTRVTFASSRI